MADEEISTRVGGRVRNEFLVCYDLVKIWKTPFQNPHKKNSRYKIDGETLWHKIGGIEHRMDCKKNTWLVGVQFAEYKKKLCFRRSSKLGMDRSKRICRVL